MPLQHLQFPMIS